MGKFFLLFFVWCDFTLKKIVIDEKSYIILNVWRKFIFMIKLFLNMFYLVIYGLKDSLRRWIMDGKSGLLFCQKIELNGDRSHLFKFAKMSHYSICNFH